MNRRYDIVVIGGGVTGLMAATLLAKGPQREAMDITLVDAVPRPVFSPDDEVALRVSAIATGTAEMFDSVGAWEYTAATRVAPYTSMRVWDENDTPESAAALHFDADEFAIQQLGFIVENVLLQDVLLYQLDRTDATLKFESPIRALHRTARNYELKLESGESLTADLVIGADGARSFVRSAVGIEANEWPYEQTAFVTHLQPRETTWWDSATAVHARWPLRAPAAPGRPRIGRVVDHAGARKSRACGRRRRDRPYAERSVRLCAWQPRGYGPRPKGAFPLCARHATSYVLPNLALIGDAAHAIHPLAGQGANLGLQDAAELATQVAEAIAQGYHPGDRPVLRRYERARKGANATMLHFMTGLNRLFTTDSEVIGEIRSAGMRAFNRSGPIRERAVKVALGVG